MAKGKGRPKKVEMEDVRRNMRHYLDAIKNLPKRERGVIYAHYIEEKSYSKIGEELGLSRERVRQLEGRGLFNLIKYVKRKLETK